MHCDLHLHSTCSDGTVPPAGVARLAAEAGLSAIALTDHDTFEGIAEAQAAGERLGVRVVPGVELSLPHAGSFHMIALGVDPQDEGIRAVADRLCDARGPRNAGILAKLRDLGIELGLDAVRAHAGGDVVARPHIALALVEMGAASSVQDAFDRYLGKGAAAYVERVRVSFEDALDATHAAGGATVLCHPFTLGFRVPGRAENEERALVELRAFAARGLDAVEVRYGSYSRADERFWERTADAAGLLPSGGSDFHGDVKPGLRVGIGRGRMRVPEAWLDALLERAATRRAAGA